MKYTAFIHGMKTTKDEFELHYLGEFMDEDEAIDVAENTAKSFYRIGYIELRRNDEAIIIWSLDN